MRLLPTSGEVEPVKETDTKHDLGGFRESATTRSCALLAKAAVHSMGTSAGSGSGIGSFTIWRKWVPFFLASRSATFSSAAARWL
jgi:hypothetical protein